MVLKELFVADLYVSSTKLQFPRCDLVRYGAKLFCWSMRAIFEQAAHWGCWNHLGNESFRSISCSTIRNQHVLHPSLPGRVGPSKNFLNRCGGARSEKYRMISYDRAGTKICFSFLLRHVHANFLCLAMVANSLWKIIPQTAWPHWRGSNGQCQHRVFNGNVHTKRLWWNVHARCGCAGSPAKCVPQDLGPAFFLPHETAGVKCRCKFRLPKLAQN